MTIEEIRRLVESFESTLVLAPGPGDGTPELAWGDLFFYYAPDGVLPPAQPFATVVTKDYPGEPSSDLGAPDAFRVNVNAGAEAFVVHTGRRPQDAPGPDEDPRERDRVLAHPVYGAQGWLAVVEPGPSTDEGLQDLLRQAHERARARWDRRQASDASEG